MMRFLEDIERRGFIGWSCGCGDGGDRVSGSNLNKDFWEY